MNLRDDLARAKIEEDSKDADIKALNLKGVFKRLVDIQTEEVWFEAKESATPPILMFAQLLVYVRAARKRGEPNSLKPIACPSLALGSFLARCPPDIFNFQKTGAQKRTRTSTPLRAPAPEAGASTNSAIWARCTAPKRYGAG